MFQKCPTSSWAFLWMSETTLCSLTRLSIMLISTFVAQEETLLVKRLQSSSRLLSKSTKMSSTELQSRSLTNSTPPKTASLHSRPSQPTMRAYLSLSLNLWRRLTVTRSSLCKSSIRRDTPKRMTFTLESFQTDVLNSRNWLRIDWNLRTSMVDRAWKTCSLN
jgi:hypothetical protein